MKEHIYTIPVTEAFEKSAGRCPFCALYEKLEKEELDLILGASMMEPDVRKITNEKGFCGRHYAMMRAGNNKLGLALILESHLEELKSDIKPGNFLSRDIGAKRSKRIEKLNDSCYVCDRIDEKIAKMYVTAAYLYDEEKSFREKFDAVPCFCLPHHRALIAAGSVLPKDGAKLFSKALCEKAENYLASLKDDVSLFCRKFDYASDDIPWGNSRDSIERSIKFLKGERDLKL
ncbi:MAG: hypothetical protein J5793_02780 [Clostridia bacterium]|nr:hypothetical protein [Clostridia bacterium]